MPTRRLVVALTVLLLGVFGVGIVTALGRIDDDGTPSAQPSSSFTPSFSPFPTEPTTAPPTDQPSEEPTPEPTAEPTKEPNATGEPTVAPTGTAKPGVPNMPKTGAPFAVAVAATLVAGSAVVVRRVSAQ